MFKYFALLILTAVLCHAKPTKIQDSQSNPGTTCTKKLNLPLNNNFLQRGLSGDADSSDPAYQKFIVCLMRENSVINENGTIKQQTLINILAEGPDRKLLEEVIQKCDVGVVAGDSADDTAFKFHACFWTNKRFEV